MNVPLLDGSSEEKNEGRKKEKKIK